MEVYVPTQGSERSCVKDVDFVVVSTLFYLDVELCRQCEIFCFKNV
jgi:hypothetical protein